MQKKSLKIRFLMQIQSVVEHYGIKRQFPGLLPIFSVIFFSALYLYVMLFEWYLTSKRAIQ